MFSFIVEGVELTVILHTFFFLQTAFGMIPFWIYYSARKKTCNFRQRHFPQLQSVLLLNGMWVIVFFS
jgi:cell shape-determining protein MreD